MIRTALPLAWPVVRAIHWLPLLAVTPVVPGLAGLLSLARPLTGPDALILLRAAGLLLGAAAAFTLADGMAGSTGAVPSPRWLRQWLRTGLALGYGAAAWTAGYALVAGWSVEAPPLPATGLEAMVMMSVGLAGAGVAVRWVPERHGAAAGAAVLFTLLVATVFLPAGWSPWVGAGAPQWHAAHAGWLASVPLVVAALAVAHRDTR